ncbi:MAG TPA: hypothetical protein VLT47_07865 [Anaeromyxobacteraceae bacterium]|nr:hypothetical protein [Anaeromyxobacteraceae bacterium]
MTLALGGPGVACSSMRVRRLEAGELIGDERARTESHLATCGRCQAAQRELAQERAQLARELPFEALAAGVAERRARPPPRRAPRGLAGLALAAGIAAAIAVPALRELRSRDDAGYRLKGGAELTLYARGDGAARALPPAEPIPSGAPLRIALAPAGRRYAAVALLDADGAAVLYAGEAAPGVLPGAFEWTGDGDGTLVAVLDDAPIDADALAARLSRGGLAAASPGGGAEVVVRALRRAR